MSPFNAKPLATLTVGELLVQARRKRGWSTNELAHATGVTKRFIVALEEDNHANLPGDIYARQWLRQLAKQLQLDGSSLATQWFTERQRVRLGTNQTISPAAHAITSRQMRWAAASAVIIAALSFLGARLYAVVAPPPLTITSPGPDTTVLGDVFRIELAGTTAPEATVTINRQVVTAAVGGSFNVIVPLQRGVNTITVSSRAKHGFSATVRRVVIVGAEKEDKLP